MKESADCPVVAVEALDARHARSLRRLMLSLDRADRCRRFGWAASDGRVVDHADRAIATASRLAGVFVAGELRGVIELYRSEDPALGEAALVVEPDWRRRGLASALLRNARDWASGASFDAIQMIFPRHDWRMRGLANKVGARLDLLLDELVAEIAVNSVANAP